MAASRRFVLKLSGDLGLHQAAAVCDEVHAAVSDNAQVAVDDTGIAEIDLSIVQILVAAFLTAEAAGKEFSVRFPAEGGLDRLLRRAGFLSPDGGALTPPSGLWVRKAA